MIGASSAVAADPAGPAITTEAQLLVRRLGLDPQQLREDEGRAAVQALDDALACVLDAAADGVQRAAVAEALVGLAQVQSKQKQEKILQALEAVFSTLASVLLQSDDGAGDAGEGYVHGVQRVAEHLSEFLRRECSGDSTGQLVDACVPLVFRTLNAARGVALQEGENTPASSRGSTLLNLLNMLPRSFTVDASIEPVQTLCAYIIGHQHVQMIQFRAVDTLVRLYETTPGIVASHAELLLSCLSEPGTETIAESILADSSLYVNEKDAFHQHLDTIASLEFKYAAPILQHIVSAGNAVKLIKCTPKLVDTVLQQNMATVALQILKHICLIEPKALRSHMDNLFVATKGAQPTLVLYADLAATIATLSKDEADKQFRLLCDLITLESTPKSAQKRILTSVTNIIYFCSGPHVAEPYLDALQNIRQANPSAVQALEDFVFEREVGRESIRGQAVDHESQRMNNEIRETCLSFEDVKRYFDLHLSELREFILHVSKKLPLPRSLAVTSPSREKTLSLVFVCPRSGLRHSVQTKEWSKWLKLGFALIRAGRCTVQLGGDNPLGVMSTGVDVVQDVYDMYCSDMEEDFHNYILEPVLTIGEREQLLRELQTSDLFSTFFYDSRTMAWCARAAMTEEEARTIPPPCDRNQTASEETVGSDSSRTQLANRLRASTAVQRASQFVRSLSSFRLHDSTDESLDLPIAQDVEHILPYISCVIPSYKATSKRYVTYELQLRVEEHEWTVHRRYRKFARLYNTVCNSGYELRSPMPPKRFWNNYDLRVLEERKRAFQQIVNELLSYRPLVARSKKVRDFFGLSPEVTALVSPPPLRESEALIGKDDDADSPPNSPKSSLPVSKSSQFLEWLSPESDGHNHAALLALDEDHELTDDALRASTASHHNFYDV